MTECYCEPETGVTCLLCQYRAEIERLRARLALAERAVAELAYIHAAPSDAPRELIWTDEGRAILAAWEAAE